MSSTSTTDGSFFSLTPEVTLDSVESALDSVRRGNRATGRVFALNSVENRVYQIELEDGNSVIAKFYRPGRWNAEQILEEHRFTAKLKEAEVPVAKPLELFHGEKITLHGDTLAQTPEGIYFALFERIRGKMQDELKEPELRHLGRFLARLHTVGASVPCPNRVRLTPEVYGEASLQFLLGTEFLVEPFRSRYTGIVESIIKAIRTDYSSLKMHTIHGDCHLGNVLWNAGGPFFVDFDDVVTGPPVQDVWMILRGRDDVALKARDELLSGYEEMRDFDHTSLRWIEPLRALRLIHYSAWIARRWNDPSFPKMFPEFGTAKYWQSEIEALSEILELVTA